MNLQFNLRYPEPARMVALSVACHLALLLLIVKWHGLPGFENGGASVTYIDMVDLPGSSPRSGTTEAATAPDPGPPLSALAPPPPAATALPVPQPMTPAPVYGANPQALNEMLAKVAQAAEARRLAEVRDRIRKNGGRLGTPSMPGPAGMPGGSDSYSSYIQSRLIDAFRLVMVAHTTSPQAVVSITIAGDGALVDYHLEQSSGDPNFNDSVIRAVTRAGRSLNAPPGGVEYQRLFRFRPEGVALQ